MRYPAYPEYKESGVQWLGQVPGHWEVKRARFAMRVNPPSPLVRLLAEESEVSFVPMDTVNEYGGLRLDQTRVKGEVGGGYTEFQDGDVVIAKITPCFENGKGSLAAGLVNSAAYGTTELHVLRAGQPLNKRFLFYLTITHGFRKLGESEMYGAGGQKRVPPEFCKDFLTPLPPLPEQTAIADFLDRETGRIDTLVAKKRRLIALLKEKRTALISRSVTRGLPEEVAREFGLEPHSRFKDSGIEWLGDVPEGWEAIPLRYLVTIKGGATPDKSNSDYWEGMVPWVSPKDMKTAKIFDAQDHVSDEAIENSALVVLPEFSILIVVRGMILAHSFPVALTTVKATINQDMKALLCGPRIDPLFFSWLLTGLSKVFVSLTDESAHGTRKLETETIKAFILNVPPQSEQTVIAAYLDRETNKIDQLVEKIEAAIDRLQEYRTALITAAVTGKIDVRNTHQQEAVA